MDGLGPDINWLEGVALPTAGVVAAVVLWRRGYLSKSALAHVPRRDAGLELIDVMVGLVLMFLGMVAASLMMAQLGLWGNGDGSEAVGLSPRQYLQQALIGQGLVQLPVVLYVIWRCAARPEYYSEIGLWPRRLVREVLIAMLALLAVLPMALGLSVLMVYAGQWLGRPAPEIGHELLGVLQEPGAAGWVKVGLLVSAVVLAPLFEEIIFRGLVQTGFLSVTRRGRRWWIVLIAALIFTGMHTSQPWQVLPSLFVLGVVLGWLYERTGSLWPSIFVHAGFNAVNVALAL